jgi:hypothetical protein
MGFDPEPFVSTKQLVTSLTKVNANAAQLQSVSDCSSGSKTMTAADHLTWLNFTGITADGTITIPVGLNTGYEFNLVMKQRTSEPQYAVSVIIPRGETMRGQTNPYKVKFDWLSRDTYAVEYAVINFKKITPTLWIVAHHGVPNGAGIVNSCLAL